MSKVEIRGREAVERLTDGLGYAPEDGAVQVDTKDLKILLEYLEALSAEPTKNSYYISVMGYLTKYGHEVHMDLTNSEARGVRKLAEKSQGWPKITIREEKRNRG